MGFKDGKGTMEQVLTSDAITSETIDQIGAGGVVLTGIARTLVNVDLTHLSGETGFAVAPEVSVQILASSFIATRIVLTLVRLLVTDRSLEP